MEPVCLIFTICGAATLAGGNVRVGLEDNLWLGKGQLATNAQLVERAVTIIENMGARVIGHGLMKDIVDLFLTTPFEGGGRHELRVGMIADAEKAGNTHCD